MNIKKSIPIIILFFITLFCTIPSRAQFGTPPNPGGSPNKDIPPLGGGAPLGGGTLILISLGAVYGIKKYQQLKHSDELKDS